MAFGAETLKHVLLRTLAATERKPPLPLRDARNFLLLQHASALGSVIHATPLIPAIRAAVPGARIIVAASGFSAQVFRRNPGVDLVHPIPNPFRQPRSAAHAIYAALDIYQPYATITTTGNERTKIALASWLAGAKNRVGFTLAPELYRTPLIYDPSISQIANNLRIVEALGHDPSEHYEPQIFFSEDNLAQARTLLGDTYEAARPLAVFVTQTSPTQRKSWRTERFVAAAQFLIDMHNAEIVFVGTSGEREAVDGICRRIHGTTFNLAGQTNIRQLSALLNLCTVGLTLDTGTMHLGRAVGLPMVIIAPAWSPPIEWLPIDNPRYTILKNATLPTAPPDYIIDEVSVDEVTASLSDLLERYPVQRMAISSR